jgi:hypothetical protein
MLYLYTALVLTLGYAVFAGFMVLSFRAGLAVGKARSL